MIILFPRFFETWRIPLKHKKTKVPYINHQRSNQNSLAIRVLLVVQTCFDQDHPCISPKGLNWGLGIPLACSTFEYDHRIDHIDVFCSQTKCQAFAPRLTNDLRAAV